MGKLCLLLLTLAVLLLSKTSMAQGVKARPRQGECPRKLQVLPSKMSCTCDGDCPREHKCCKFDEGTACVPPIQTICPWIHWGMGLCAEFCRSDKDCKDSVQSKCCFNGCGHQCTEPQIVKAGACGNPKVNPMCAKFCSHDGNCPRDQKCCSTDYGYICSDPC